MGLLAPLYIFGALAIGIPILLHLIRRTPQGRQPFSSLMFLSPSPPRLTRRSRLSNLLLLLLRAAAFLLLALAFARPFLQRNDNQLMEASSGRRILLLVDTSASMRRSGMWNQVQAQLDAALKDVTPADEVALCWFDQGLRPALTFDQWTQAEASSRLALLRSAFAAGSPTWSGTRIGDALSASADLLAATDPNEKRHITRIVRVISDLQEGSRPQALQAREWPATVSVSMFPVSIPAAGNASLEVMKPAPDEPADGKLRVRVRNEAGSTRDQFSLAWATARGTLPEKSLDVYVAAGRSQVFRLAWPDAPATGPGAAASEMPDRLVLSGDDADFDDTLYLAPPRIESVRLVYIGEETGRDVSGMRFFLENALAASAQRKMEFVARLPADALADADLRDVRCAVVGAVPGQETLAKLHAFVESGGTLLWVARDAASAQAAGRFLGIDLAAREASGDYALLTRFDAGHPLFAPFSDVRFGDFSRIHFWRHRVVTWPSEAPNAPRAVASFDSGDPYVLEGTLGRGRMELMTAGWELADSQLALSPKFLPMMDALVARPDAGQIAGSYVIGETISLPAPRPGETRAIVAPDGTKTDLSTVTTFAGTTMPGIYQLTLGDLHTAIAVNLSPEESRTVAYAPADFRQWGVPLDKPETPQQMADQERALRVAELENRQKVWRWLLLAVLGLLAMETALAGRLSRGNQLEKAAP